MLAEQTMSASSSTAASGSPQLSTATSKAQMPSPSTFDGPTSSLQDHTQSQTQKYTPELGESLGLGMKNTGLAWGGSFIC